MNLYAIVRNNVVVALRRRLMGVWGREWKATSTPVDPCRNREWNWRSRRPNRK